MEQVAATLAEQGNQNAADFLQNVVTQLTAAISNSSSTATTEETLNFLFEVLQAVSDSNGDPQVVYPLMQANLEKLDDRFAQLLQNWATATLPEAEPDRRLGIALVIGNFSNLIQDFPLGNRASNLEIAIAGYEVVATVFTHEAFPEQWASAQNNLGAAYSNRFREDRAQNLELAIECYKQALQVYTRNDFPVAWATTQNNLGTAYSDQGQTAAALQAFNSALQIFTPQAIPLECLETGRNLGNTAFAAGLWIEAIEGYRVAIDAVEQSRTWATSRSLRSRSPLCSQLPDPATNPKPATQQFQPFLCHPKPYPGFELHGY